MTTDDGQAAPFDTTNHLAGDSGVVSRLTKASPDSVAYNKMLEGRRLAVSFHAEAELRHPALGETRRKQVAALLAVTLILPHSSSTSTHYARVQQQRKVLRDAHELGEGAGDGDMWVLSSALEYGVPLMSHDRNLVALGRSMGHPVLTNLPVLRDENPSLS